MIENYKDYCVLKAFDLTNEQVEAIISSTDNSSVKIDLHEKHLDYKIVLINEHESEVVFNNILSNILDIAKDRIYSDNEATLESEVIKRAKEKNIKIALAESLTGGLVSATLVNVSGASSVFYEGFVTYSSMSKVRRLHVKSTTLDEYGAVSEQICSEMVQGVMANKEIQIAVATTGCAGPDSDEFGTPVGRVYVGIGGAKGIEVKTLNLKGDRDYIRKAVTNIALYMMLEYIEKI